MREVPLCVGYSQVGGFASALFGLSQVDQGQVLIKTYDERTDVCGPYRDGPAAGENRRH